MIEKLPGRHSDFLELPFLECITTPEPTTTAAAIFTPSEHNIPTTRAGSLALAAFRENATNAVPAVLLRAF